MIGKVKGLYRFVKELIEDPPPVEAKPVRPANPVKSPIKKWKLDIDLKSTNLGNGFAKIELVPKNSNYRSYEVIVESSKHGSISSQAFLQSAFLEHLNQAYKAEQDPLDLEDFQSLWDVLGISSSDNPAFLWVLMDKLHARTLMRTSLLGMRFQDNRGDDCSFKNLKDLKLSSN